MNNELANAYYLERFLLGELPEQESHEIQKMIADDSSLQKTIQEIETSTRKILARYCPSATLAHLKDRLKEEKNRPLLSRMIPQSLSTRRIIYISSALVSVALFLILIQPGGKDKIGTFPLDFDADTSLVKGFSKIDHSMTQLLVFRKSKNSVDVLEDRNRAKVGDLLQLAYITVEKKYGMILSLDARGTITLHFPSGLSESTELEMFKQAFLPNAFELDDAPDFERFLFITSDSPINVTHVLKQAKKLASDPVQAKKERLDLPPEFNQYSILIFKGEPT